MSDITFYRLVQSETSDMSLNAVGYSKYLQIDFRMASTSRFSNTTKHVAMATTVQPQYSTTRMQSLAFAPLNADGSNFLEWVNDAKADLATDDLSATLESEGEEEIEQVYKSQAMLTLQRHLDQSLRLQYIIVTNLYKLRGMLHARFNHQ